MSSSELLDSYSRQPLTRRHFSNRHVKKSGAMELSLGSSGLLILK